MMGYGKFRWEFETLLQFDGDGAGGSLSGKWEAGSVHQRAAAALWWMGWKDISDAARSGANALHAGRHRASKGVIRRRRTSQGATRYRCGRARSLRQPTYFGGVWPFAMRWASRHFTRHATLLFCKQRIRYRFFNVSMAIATNLHSNFFSLVRISKNWDVFFPFLLSFFEKRNFDLKKWIKFQFG